MVSKNYISKKMVAQIDGVRVLVYEIISVPLAITECFVFTGFDAVANQAEKDVLKEFVIKFTGYSQSAIIMLMIAGLRASLSRRELNPVRD